MADELATASHLICAIGDSRTFGAGATIGHDPVGLLGKSLEAAYPNSTFAVNNQAINGTTSNHWLYASLLPPALESFRASAAALPEGTETYVQIMLGINDASGFGFGRCTLPDYLLQMQGIVDAIRAANLPGFAGVVLHTSFYAVRGGFAAELDEQCLNEVQRFNAALPTLVDGRNVFMGDVQAYERFEQQPDLLFDKLHASNEGNAMLAELWGQAYRAILSASCESPLVGAG